MSTQRLYRCYDADGRLLYIGCTNDPEKRRVAHMKSGAVASLLLKRYMTTFVADADVYPDLAAGRAAERECIAAEQPIFNIHHRRVPSWLIAEDIDRYMAGEPTANWHAYLAALEAQYRNRRATKAAA